MATLMELANVPRVVTVEDKSIEVQGISGEGLAKLFARFPDIGKAFAGGTPDRAELAKMAPEALGAVIAIACGYGDKPDNERIPAEAAARKLGIGVQMAIMSEVFRLTFPQGVGPFVEALERMGLAQGLAATLPSQQSPETQTNSSQSDTTRQASSG